MRPPRVYEYRGPETLDFEELMKRGITPGILKSANFPGGNDYNKSFVEPQYEEKGY